MAKKPKPSGKKTAAKKGGAKKPEHRLSQLGDNARIAISDKDLKYLAGFADESLNKAGTITSALGQEISTYAKKGLNAPAFRTVLRMVRMGKRDPIKLRAFRDDVEHYADVLGLDKLTAADMFRDGKDAKPKSSQPKKTAPKADGRQTDLEEHIEQSSGLAETQPAGSA